MNGTGRQFQKVGRSDDEFLIELQTIAKRLFTMNLI